MKRRIALITVLALMVTLFSGCCLKHEWQEATCTAPKTCAKCEKTEGEPLGHTWEDATCIDPEVCSVCGEEQGAPLGHTWMDATCIDPEVCSVCGDTQGDPLGHDVEIADMNTDGYSGICNVCNEDVTVAVTDWDALGRQLIVGEWNGALVSNSHGTFDVSDDGYAYGKFEADGTARVTLGDIDETGTWKLQRTSTTDEGKVGFIYEVKLDSTYTFIIMAMSEDTVRNTPVNPGVVLTFRSSGGSYLYFNRM